MCACVCIHVCVCVCVCMCVCGVGVCVVCSMGVCVYVGGGGGGGEVVAQLAEHIGLEIQRPEVRTPSVSGEQVKFVRVFPSQNMLW